MRLLWVYIFCIALWGLDFKASRSGAAAMFQGVILLLFLSCSIWIALAAARMRCGVGPLWVLIGATGLFVLDSSTVGLIQEQAPYQILVTLIPLLLYLIAALTTYVMLSMFRQDQAKLIDGLRIACVVSPILHLIITDVSRGGINLSTVRFEVLSGCVIPALGVLALGLSQPLTRLDFAVILINLAVTLLSVTRTLIIILAVQIGFVVLMRPAILLRRASQRGIALLVSVLGSVLLLDFLAGTGLSQRWLSRLLLSKRLGEDPSKLLRIAETHYMWDHFASSLQTLVFGNGIAAVTSAIGREDARVAFLVGYQSAQIHMIGIGHENYVSILYTAGLLGGGALLLMQLINGLQALSVLHRLEAPAHAGSLRTRIGLWGSVIVLGMLTNGVFAGTFDDRAECLWFGIGTGMLYWCRHAGSVQAPARRTSATSAR